MALTDRVPLANDIIAEHLQANDPEDAEALQRVLIRSHQLFSRQPGFQYFAYGSQMWRPSFKARDFELVTLCDFKRDYCIVSTHHRGNSEQPGLVLGIRPCQGAILHGMCFDITDQDLLPLLHREMRAGVYRPTWVTVTAGEQQRVALTFVACSVHEQVIEHPINVQAEIIVHASGCRGPNLDYFEQTQDILRRLNIHDPELDELEQAIRSLQEKQTD